MGLHVKYFIIFLTFVNMHTICINIYNKHISVQRYPVMTPGNEKIIYPAVTLGES